MLTADQSRSSPLGYIVSFDSDYMQPCFAISGLIAVPLITPRAVMVLLFAVSNGAIIEKCRDIAVQPNCLIVIRDSTVVLAFQPINYAAIVVCVGEARIKKDRLIIIL